MIAAVLAAGGAGAWLSSSPGTEVGGVAANSNNAPGVTKNTIKVGFIVNRGADEAFASFYEAAGLEANFRYGDEKRQVEALVADLNRRGGIRGRRVIAVISEANVFGNDYPRVCAHLTEDEKVFMAITSETVGQRPELANCFSGRSTLLLTTPLISGDDQFMKDVSPWYRIPTALADARMWRTLIPDLHEQGYFGPDAKVGLVVVNDPRMRRMAEQVVKPELQKIGVPVVAEYEHRMFGRNIVGGVVKFKAAGVTHVVLVPAFELAWLFWRDAFFQGFEARYLIESGYATEFLRHILPKVRLPGSAGIGWRPQYDVPEIRQPLSDGEKQCFGRMRKAGVAVRGRQDPYPATILCDNLMLFEAAAKKAGENLTHKTFVDALHSLGSVPSALGLGPLDLARRTPDAVDVYRRVVYDDGCTCFVYSGPTKSVRR